MKKLFRSLLLLLVPVLSLAQMNPTFILQSQRHKHLNNTIYDPYIQVPVGRFDVFANNRSFGIQGSKLVDGDISTSFIKGSQNTPYWPDEEIINLNGLYALDRIELWDVGGGANYIVKSGLNQFDSLTLDYNLTLNLNQKRVLNFSGKQVKFISLKLNHTQAEVKINPSLRQGPAEVRIYGKLVSLDPIPAKVERPRRGFGQLLGMNMDIFSPPNLYTNWAGSHFRAYDLISKFQDTTPPPNTKYAFKNGYQQGYPYDDTLRDRKNKGIEFFFVMTGLSIPRKLYEPSYLAAGSTTYDSQGQFNKAIQFGANAKDPQSYKIIAEAAYQYALHFGCSATIADTVKAKIDHVRDGYPTKVGTCYSNMVEFGNEEDNWFRNPKEGYDPDEFWAKCSALYDGDEGRLGAGFGFKSADPNFKVVMAASADFGLDFIKRGYYWAKKNRIDGKLPVDVINVHSYLNSGGGQFVIGASGVAPELYTRDGYLAVGVRQYLDEFSDWVKRYCPGKEIWWTEFGYDSNPYSYVGVPMITQAQAATAGKPLNSHQVQAALILRTYFEAMSTTSVDKMTLFTMSNYSRINEGIQRFKDLNESTVPYWSSNNFTGAPGEQFATSGLTLNEFGWTQATSSSVNVATVTAGTTITLTLDSLRPFWIFSGVIQLRDPADAAGNGAHVYCNVVSQSRTQLVLQVANVGPGGIAASGTGSFTTWRLDTHCAKKLSWFAVDNAYAVLDTAKKLVSDLSTSEFRHYVYQKAGGTQQVHALYLPSQVGNKLNRTVALGANNAIWKDLESVTGVTKPLTVSSNNVTIDITEMPKLIICNTNGNAFPVLNAGTDKTVSTSSTTVTATATDPDGTIASYSWKRLFGGAASMSGANTATLSLSSMSVGTYIFSVTATDNQGAQVVDDVIVTVTSSTSNVAPTANAGTDQSITASSTSVTGSGADSDGSIASYSWARVSGPNTPTVSGASTPTLTLSGMVTGTYVYSLTVTDNLGLTGTDNVSISVTLSSNPPPTVPNFGPINITQNHVDLYDNGSGANSPATSISAYLWSLVSGPNTPTMSGTTTNHCVVTGLINGNYVFSEKVTDNLGGFTIRNGAVNVTGLSGGNISPVANAGSDVTTAATSVTINGSGTDSDGTISSYSWTRVSGPNTPTASGASTANISLSGLVIGNYVYQLTVTDNLGATGVDNVTLTITSSSGAATSQLIVTTFHSAIGGGSGQDIVTQVYLPVGYGNGTTFPVIVFCHGEGEKYNGTNSLSTNIANLNSTALPKYLKDGNDIPFVVIMPQIGLASFDSKDNSVQEPGLLTNELAAWAVTNYSGDPQRCHLTGLSFGGQTICPSAENYPNRWATCVAISTAPDGYPNADLCRAVFWWFAGDADGLYFAPANQVAWINELNSHGAIAFTSKYTIFSGVGHTGWTPIYNNTASSTYTLRSNSDVPNNTAAGNIYTWMLQYKIVSGTVQLTP
jgi:hypothetical protein